MDAKIEFGLTVSVSLWTAVDMNKHQLKRWETIHNNFPKCADTDSKVRNA